MGTGKCARRVRLMVLREEQLPLVAAESGAQLARGIQLLFHPEGAGLHKRPKSAGRDGEVGFENAKARSDCAIPAALRQYSTAYSGNPASPIFR